MLSNYNNVETGPFHRGKFALPGTSCTYPPGWAGLAGLGLRDRLLSQGEMVCGVRREAFANLAKRTPEFSPSYDK